MRAIHTFSIQSLVHPAVIRGDFISISLQNVYLYQFVLNFQNTNISQIANLKTLTLDKCTIDNEYFIDIFKRCKNITHVNICTSTIDLSMNQLAAILRSGYALEKQH